MIQMQEMQEWRRRRMSCREQLAAIEFVGKIGMADFKAAVRVLRSG